MSLWTHFAGIVRVDTLCGDDTESMKAVTNNIKGVLGKIITYEDLCEADIDEELQTPLPNGREGSLRYQVLESEGRSVITHIVVLWGDLRDYGYNGDKEFVKDWWKKTLNAILKIDGVFSIRQAVLNVGVEGSLPFNLQFVD